MSILNKIIAHKKNEIQHAKDFITIKRLETSLFFDGPTVSMVHYLRRPDKSGVIAEIKRQSPSAGIMNDEIDVEKLSISYMQSGASALSILTDKTFFGGRNEDLQIARTYNFCPILRKDFIIDEYQIVEAKSIGADCILLIAACLTPAESRQLAAFAHWLQLEVLLEVHEKEEIDSYINEHIDIIGVNNRDLQSFHTNLEKSMTLYEFLPNELAKISESGISHASDMLALQKCGYDGFLIGGHFMKKSEPAQACKQLIEEFKAIQV